MSRSSVRCRRCNHFAISLRLYKSWGFHISCYVDLTLCQLFIPSYASPNLEVQQLVQGVHTQGATSQALKSLHLWGIPSLSKNPSMRLRRRSAVRALHTYAGEEFEEEPRGWGRPSQGLRERSRDIDCP